MSNKRIEELLNAYEDKIKKTVLKALEKEEEKISLINPVGIKQDLKEIIDEVVADDN
ncbi:hypothetical protein MWH28_07255 [Natroniella sulfidigena]|uniref:hypothetical protein n=1 Tax=Natroniella sulfidigena TaxID=723921 RepID=UPI00200A4CE3|nr:hypothetical protein [Natroniella sulfidigena]MCK8817156.1 hypothetical protein [Natroniella sulfidigena]